MADTAPSRPVASYAWPLVLCLVGLDYFSTLAYLPSIAVEAAGPLAPLAVLGVVAVTLCAALPLYCYVVGRSPHGHGATGLLVSLVHGWFGKVLILVLIGFIGTDFIVTRSLSTSDATTHLIQNPLWKQDVDWLGQNKEALRGRLPEFLQGRFFDFWDEQLVVTLLLSVLGFFFWALLQGRFTRWFLRLTATVVVLYLLLTAVVVGSGLVYLFHHPDILQNWWHGSVPRGLGATTADPLGLTVAVGLLVVLTFPQMALGLSGFELSMASAPLVRSRDDDDPALPRGRVRNTRKLLFAAATIMAVFVAASVLVTTLLLPADDLIGRGPAAHRALAYLAHGAPRHPGTPAGDLNPLFGPAFGTLYDLSSILILCLAGASATIGFREVAPYYLARFGMQLPWAQKIGVIQHLFNVVILVVTLVFRASVSAQQWAYATGVLVLLSSAAVAATLDVRARWAGSRLRPFVQAPFLLYSGFFLGAAALTAYFNRTGVGIALSFVGIVFGTAFLSRWMRSTELRFEGFTFADDYAEARWKEIRELDFQVLIPHRPGRVTLAHKEREVRGKHRIPDGVPLIFIEVEVGDPSDFYQQPLMRVENDDGREVIRVSHCASVAHVLAAIGLEFRHVGKPPEIIFGWSNENPMAANLHFLLLGEGNVPWLVHQLVRKVEPDPAKQPRVVIG